MFKAFAQKLAERRKWQKAHDDGRAAGAAMTAAIDEYLSHRLKQVSEKLLDVLRHQLTTIHNEAGYKPADVARVEFKIFLENLETFDERILADAEAACADWFELAETLELTDQFREFALQRIDDAKLALIIQGVEITGQVIVEEEGEPDPAFDVSKFVKPENTDRVQTPNNDTNKEEDKKRRREKWKTFYWFLGFSILEIGVLAFVDLNFDFWKSWIIVLGAVFFPVMALLSYFDARDDWSVQKSDSMITRTFGWLIGGPILLVAGLVLIVTVLGWFNSIPSWASVIIVLLVAILFQLRRRS